MLLKKSYLKNIFVLHIFTLYTILYPFRVMLSKCIYCFTFFLLRSQPKFPPCLPHCTIRSIINQDFRYRPYSSYKNKVRTLLLSIYSYSILHRAEKVWRWLTLVGLLDCRTLLAMLRPVLCPCLLLLSSMDARPPYMQCSFFLFSPVISKSATWECLRSVPRLMFCDVYRFLLLAKKKPSRELPILYTSVTVSM
jgi:hypothetical protein